MNDLDRLDQRPADERLADALQRLDEAIIRRWTRIVTQPPRRGWRDRAACRGAHPDLFYPRSRDAEDHGEIHATCMSCPVLVDCLRQSIIDEEQHQEIHGTLGGLTASQRREWWQRRNGAQ